MSSDRASADNGHGFVAAPALRAPIQTPDAADDTLVSTVVALGEDARAIAGIYRRLCETFGAIGLDRELVFVNDGGPEDAREALAELASRDRKVVVVNHTRRFGSQGAFASGLRVATGDAVVLLDGARGDPPELIAQLLERWWEGFDVVYGVATEHPASPIRGAVRGLLHRAFRRLSDVPLDASDFGLLDRRVVDTLNGLPESNRLIAGLRAWVGYAQVGVRYVRPRTQRRRGVAAAIGSLTWARRAIVSSSYVPLDLIAWLALLAVGFSVVGLVTQLTLRFVDASLAPKGFTTVIVGMLFIGGIQLICLAIIGSYLAHIYDENRRRPAFLVESVINDPAERTAETGRDRR
jgi:dolichol-phosphate mannosyltransferase